MNAQVLLRLGRTSNLPTVWSNVLCGAILSGLPFGPVSLLVLLLAGSAFYVGGMFLNDAFDAELDRLERPERPIPAGLITREFVLRIGFGLLAFGLVLLGASAFLGLTWPGIGSSLAGIFTCTCVLIYNRWHKGHAWSPVVMGACRAGLYMTAALAVSGVLGADLLLAALALLLYIVGLTHIARFETGKVVDRAWPTAFLLSPLVLAGYRWWKQPELLPLLCIALLLGWTLRSLSFALGGGQGQIPRAVVTLIAGIALLDALFISLYGPPLAVLAAFGAFLLTLKWQRRIPGT